MPKKVIPTESTSLKISAAPQKQLSKIQTQFNQQIRRIEKLQKEIPLEVAKYDQLQECANQHILPAYEKIAQAQIKIAVELDKVGLTLGYKKKQLNDLGRCIEYLLTQAYNIVDLSEAEKALFQRWAGTTVEEMEAEREADQRQMSEAFFEALYGVEVDMEAIQNDPEAFAEFQRQLDEQDKQREREEEERSANKKKSKQAKANQTKREAMAKAQEELKSKSVRSIYISLAKLMHPDMESDPSLRAAKEEQMKKLSAAYEANDLATLLKMEMEWIHAHDNTLDTIPEERLKIFVEVLRDQVFELEMEKDHVRWRPKYEEVAEYGYGRIEIGIQNIKKRASFLLRTAKKYETMRRTLVVPDAKKAVTAYVKDLIWELDLDSPPDIY